MFPTWPALSKPSALPSSLGSRLRASTSRRSSFKVFFAGWLVAVLGATGLGLLLGRSRLLGNIFLPVIEAIRPVSSIAWVPLSIVWFGFGFTSKAFLVGLAVFLVVIVYAV